MENKYYTPSIEEFYIGFKYEVLQQEMQADEYVYGNEWEEIYYDGSYVLNKIDLNHIRVKHLNEEDIESLGFRKSTYKDSICYTKGNCQIFFFPHNMVPHCNIISIDLFVGNFRDQYFRGLIKNKSELKWLLKQISGGI